MHSRVNLETEFERLPPQNDARWTQLLSAGSLVFSFYAAPIEWIFNIELSDDLWVCSPSPKSCVIMEMLLLPPGEGIAGCWRWLFSLLDQGDSCNWWFMLFFPFFGPLVSLRCVWHSLINLCSFNSAPRRRRKKNSGKRVGKIIFAPRLTSLLQSLRWFIRVHFLLLGLLLGLDASEREGERKGNEQIIKDNENIFAARRFSVVVKIFY